MFQNRRIIYYIIISFFIFGCNLQKTKKEYINNSDIIGLDKIKNIQLKDIFLEYWVARKQKNIKKLYLLEDKNIQTKIKFHIYKNILKKYKKWEKIFIKEVICEESRCKIYIKVYYPNDYFEFYDLWKFKDKWYHELVGFPWDILLNKK